MPDTEARGEPVAELSEAPVLATPEPPREWRRLPSGRWAVGDEGNQERIVPQPARPWSVPDTVADGAQCNSVSYRAASLRGLSHQQYGKPRQDGFGFCLPGNGEWLVACVADGVSDGRLSHEAAAIACEQLPRRIGAAITPLGAGDVEDWPSFSEQLPWEQTISEVNSSIIDRASAWYLRHAPSNDEAGDEDGDVQALLSPTNAAVIMSTTAIALVMPTQPDAAGGHPFTVVVAAGDSSAFQMSSGVWEPLTLVKNAGADIASSTVNPLPRTQAVRFSHGRLEPGECLAVMTDGLGDPLGTGRGVVGRFLAEVWAEPPDVLSFASQLGFLRKTFVDDRTAFCVWTAR